MRHLSIIRRGIYTSLWWLHISQFMVNIKDWTKLICSLLLNDLSTFFFKKTLAIKPIYVANKTIFTIANIIYVYFGYLYAQTWCIPMIWATRNIKTSVYWVVVENGVDISIPYLLKVSFHSRKHNIKLHPHHNSGAITVKYGLDVVILCGLF